jgi:uncharacterized protein YkwD
MNSNDSGLSRSGRKFLKISLRLFLIFLIWLKVAIPSLSYSEQQPGVSAADLAKIKQELVDLINRQRRSMGLRKVELDDFASRVGEQHCQEMLKDDYISHWNRAGLKPYMRYSFAGGDDGVAENLSALHGSVRFNAENVYGVVENLHMRMYNERPPDDYHRQTILQPQHTHVGIGIAYGPEGLRLSEEFVARYVEMQPIPRSVKVGDKITIKGRLLYDQTDLHNIYIFYEPFPKPISIEELLRLLTPYGFPDDETILRPIAPAGYQYSDGGTGDVTYDPSLGKFSCQFTIPRNKRGIYTIAVLVKHEKNKFPATNISIRAE